MSPYTTTAYTTSSSCFVVVVVLLLLHLLVFPSEELWTQKFKPHLLRTQSLTFSQRVASILATDIVKVGDL